VRLIIFLFLITQCALPSLAVSQTAKRHHNRGLGISYNQVMRYLGDHFDMEKSSQVDGRDRWMGQSDNKLCLLEIIGQPKNTYEATLIVGTPNDVSMNDKAMAAGMMVRFMKNISPGWEDATEWMNDAAIEVIDGGSGTKRARVHAGRKYIISNVAPLGICISVKPA